MAHYIAKKDIYTNTEVTKAVPQDAEGAVLLVKAGARLAVDEAERLHLTHRMQFEESPREIAVEPAKKKVNDGSS
jgi:hypothetical protein